MVSLRDSYAVVRGLTEGSAAKLASDAHRGQLDKSGQPYILHPARVANNIKRLIPNPDPELLMAAWLHDVIEDCSLTAEDLIDLGSQDAPSMRLKPSVSQKMMSALMMRSSQTSSPWVIETHFWSKLQTTWTICIQSVLQSWKVEIRARLLSLEKNTLHLSNDCVKRRNWTMNPSSDLSEHPLPSKIYPLLTLCDTLPSRVRGANQLSVFDMNGR